MTEPGGDVMLVRFYCTAGNGMEAFLLPELKTKLAAQDVCQIPGKVLFSSSVRMDSLQQLKSAERVFLLVRQAPPVSLPAHISSAKAASILQGRLLGSLGDWSTAAATWSRLQGELQARSAGGERGRTQEAAQTMEGKRKREEEDDEEDDDDDRQNSLATGRLKNEKPRESPAPSFRISCRCTGALSRRFDTQQLGAVIGAALSRGLGWKADLKTPQLEVNVYLSDDHCVLGMPLTRLPLASRSYIKTPGLRSTVAWALGSLADIKPGCLVVDPMCGVGTILLEAAQEHKEAFFLGADIDDGQLRRANENVAFADLRDRVVLLKASSLGLPLPSGSVDSVVCDLPFGRKFGCKTDMAAILPLIVTEMERVLCVGGTLVLLLSPQLSCLLKKLQASSTQETGPGPRDGPSHPLSSQETGPGPQGGPSPPLSSQETGPGPLDGPSPPLSSQETGPGPQGGPSPPLSSQETGPGPQGGPSPPLSSQETGPRPGPQDSPSPPLSSQETGPGPQGGPSPPLSSQETGPRPGPQDSPSPPLSSQETGPRPLDGPSPPLSSLRLQACHRVSLGAIDGLIHKYIKMKT